MNRERYIRQIVLPQVGEAGQATLAKASVLIVGAGGLGNALVPYLASAGIGELGIVDGDNVALSNLHRQILFSERDIGLKKSSVLTAKISEQFPDVVVTDYPLFLNASNAKELMHCYELVVDATDDIESRYILDDFCYELNKPLVHASIYRFQFQVAVFNVADSGTYRCLYPSQSDGLQTCSDAGVMPTTVALAGLYQANEVLKYFIGTGELLVNKVLLVDTLTLMHSYFSYDKDLKRNGNKQTVVLNHIPEKSIEQIDENALLLDVRNRDEQPKINASNYMQVPVNELSGQLSVLDNKEVAIFCQTGKRSARAYAILNSNGHNRAYCLKEQANDIYKYLKNGKKEEA